MPEFNPQPITLQGKMYLEVAQRVFWVRTEHPDAQIVTDLIEHDPTEGRALFRATATIPSTGAVATGYGTAHRKDLRGPVAAAYVEKAETRAVGRALAGLGYGTLAALAEDDKDYPADAPAPAPQGHAAPRRPPPPAMEAPAVPANLTAPDPLAPLSTREQRQAMRAAVDALGLSDRDKATYLAPFGVAQFVDLDGEQAAYVVADLSRRAAEVQAAV